MSVSSTPQSGPRSHVVADLVSETRFVSPSTQRRHVQQTSTPLLAGFPGNDDELERRQRRRSRVIDLHLSSLDTSLAESPAQRSVTGTPASVPKLSNAQISEHYSTCIKLSTENKITTRNAFGLHLIDYMSDILREKDSELTNFKVAAGTLDASAKIYAVRVDAVHADTYRVLGGLGKDSKPGPEGEQEAQEEEGEESEGAKKPKRKKSSNKKTVEQNLNNINSSESERKCEVDPMFQKMASSFDESSTAGVFLPVLRSFDCYSELLFHSDVTPLRSGPARELPPVSRVSVARLRASLQQAQEKASICPSLEDFSFTQWTSESYNQNVSEMLEKHKRGDHVFDVHAEPESEPWDCGPGGDEDFDADACEEGKEGDVSRDEERREGCTARERNRDVIPIGEGDIGTMCLQLSSKPGEYSYFSPRTMSMWAGPGHWRFKPRHKQDDVPEKEKKKRKAKKVFELNFDEDVNFEVYFRVTRAATTFAKSALDKPNKKTTLPADFHYEPDRLLRLSLKPASTLSKLSKKRLSGEHEDGIGEYDYNNPNDTSNFCPGVQMGDSDDDDDDDHSGFRGPDGMFEMTGHPSAGESGLPGSASGQDITSYGEDNLVAEPQKVNKIELNYAKTAKKMDMRRLKRSMWCLLTDREDKAVEEDEEEREVTGEKTFGKSTRGLLHRLPSTMAKNLSVALAFAALLHLANEKNLELQKVEDLSDILIKQGH